jgi:hypothetical protein
MIKNKTKWAKNKVCKPQGASMYLTLKEKNLGFLKMHDFKD